MATIDKTIRYVAPASLNGGASEMITPIETWAITSTDECSICLSSLNQQRNGQIRGCKHQFHYACILEAMSCLSRCPLCSATIVEPQGTMPTATMTVRQKGGITCGNYGPGAIEICYQICGGVQKQYHSNPGVSYDADSRTAYLPDNAEGRLLLKRLEYAFSRGLTFTVGTSLSSGRPNVVTWSSIHHKTSPYGGVHGFPDLSYFSNCNDELDYLGVPSANAL